MGGTIKEINISKIMNCFENPRHAIATTEEDTLKKLFKAAGIQHMLNLASDIQEHGLLGSQQIVVVFSNESKKYIVYEGNRRVAAIKLLLHPEKFNFLDKSTIDKAKKIAEKGRVCSTLKCYVTDETEASFIMERIHSGEDKGRGVKQWTAREKEAFRSRRSDEQKKNLSYLIDMYVKKYCNGQDITTIIPFTTIQRLFNNHDVRKQIGLDVTNVNSFTPEKMELIVAASIWVTTEAKNQEVAVTRLFNTAKAIEERLLPWIQEYMCAKGLNPANTTVPISNESNKEQSETPSAQESQGTELEDSQKTEADVRGFFKSGSNCNEQLCATVPSTAPVVDVNIHSQTKVDGSGGNKNIPYFFQGLRYGNLDPNNPNTHGIAEICREVQLFSDKKLVATYPIASTFLIRALIEQTFIYYSKNHNIQGQNKVIWDNIKDYSNLSKKIDIFKRNLPNFIVDATMRQYFNQLFGNYETTVDPLNWVVHRPAEFQLDAQTLIELPRKGLLALINFMLS